MKSSNRSIAIPEIMIIDSKKAKCTLDISHIAATIELPEAMKIGTP
jgi:hypothetical protein